MISSLDCNMFYCECTKLSRRDNTKIAQHEVLGKSCAYFKSRRDDGGKTNSSCKRRYIVPYGTQKELQHQTQHFVLGYYPTSLRDYNSHICMTTDSSYIQI